MIIHFLHIKYILNTINKCDFWATQVLAQCLGITPGSAERTIYVVKQSSPGLLHANPVTYLK